MNKMIPIIVLIMIICNSAFAIDYNYSTNTEEERTLRQTADDFNMTKSQVFSQITSEAIQNILTERKLAQRKSLTDAEIELVIQAR